MNSAVICDYYALVTENPPVYRKRCPSYCCNKRCNCCRPCPAKYQCQSSECEPDFSTTECEFSDCCNKYYQTSVPETPVIYEVRPVTIKKIQNYCRPCQCQCRKQLDGFCDNDGFRLVEYQDKCIGPSENDGIRNKNDNCCCTSEPESRSKSVITDKCICRSVSIHCIASWIEPDATELQCFEEPMVPPSSDESPAVRKRCKCVRKKSRSRRSLRKSKSKSSIENPRSSTGRSSKSSTRRKKSSIRTGNKKMSCCCQTIPCIDASRLPSSLPTAPVSPSRTVRPPQQCAPCCGCSKCEKNRAKKSVRVEEQVQPQLCACKSGSVLYYKMTKSRCHCPGKRRCGQNVQADAKTNNKTNNFRSKYGDLIHRIKCMFLK